jgi:hypothetical protein
MLRAIVNILGNIILLPFNLAFFIPRLLYKLIFDYKAGLWIVIGKKKTTIVIDGNATIK